MSDQSKHGRPESFIARLSRAVGAPVDPEVDLHDESRSRPASGASPSSGVLSRMQARPSLSGRYHVEGEIARGGMGAILEVWDEDLRRKLAMKVALGQRASGSSSAASELDPRLLSRFLEEAQVTGQLEHPGIVPVHELGIDDDGVVFFTMQLVRGRDLGEVFDLVPAGTDGWSVTRALGVLLKVCEAMAFAHSKGVIHRDLKPANVMVGNFGEVYVMDWGLVRVRGREDRHDVRVAGEGVQGTGEGHAEKVVTDLRTDAAGDESDALYTMDGDVLGTPAYMSPEQARGEVERLDARTDVYSVGAMLYRLLAGVEPYRVRGEKRPSSVETLMALRAGPPRALGELAGDAPAELVSIAEKAMAREAGERYPDMLGLAEDLRAFLENRVVQAHQTGAFAEARKWVRRNRALSASMAAGLLALVGGLAASLWLKAESDENAGLARRQASIAREVADFMNDDLFASIAPQEEGLDVTVREVLAIASARLDGRFEDEPLVEAELRRTIGRSFERLGEYETASGHLERAHNLFVAEQGERSETALDTALLLGSTWSELERFDEALELYERALELCRVERGENDVMTLNARVEIARSWMRRGELERSVAEFERLLAVMERELGGEHPLTLDAQVGYANSLLDLGRLEQAEAVQAAALAAHREALGEGHPSTLVAADMLGDILVELGRAAEAEKLLVATQELREEVLGPDHPATANGLGRLGIHYHVRGMVAEAEKHFARGYEMLQRSLGSEHGFTLQMANNLAVAWNGLGRGEEALELRRKTLEAQKRTFGEEHSYTMESMGNMATLLQALGRIEEAEEVHLEIIALRERVSGELHPHTLIVLENYGGFLLDQGKYDESIELTTRVLEGRMTALGEGHPAVARTMFNIGIVTAMSGDPNGARAWFEEAIAVAREAEAVDVSSKALAQLAGTDFKEGDFARAKSRYEEAAEERRAFGIEDRTVADWLHEAGRSAKRLGQEEEVARLCGAAFALHRDLFGVEDPSALKSLVGQVRALQACERFEEAEKGALLVHATFLAKDGEGSRMVDQARALLANLYDAWGRPDEAARWRE